MAYDDFSRLNAAFGIIGIPGVYTPDNEIEEFTSTYTFSHLPEVRKAISETKMGTPSPFRGKSHTKEAIAKMKQSLPDRTGKKNSRALKWCLTYENGSTMIVKSLHTWAKERHLNPMSIRNVYYGKSSNYRGITKVRKLTS